MVRYVSTGVLNEPGRGPVRPPVAVARGMILDRCGRPFRRRSIDRTEYAGIEAGRDVTRDCIDDRIYLSSQDKVLRYQGGTN